VEPLERAFSLHAADPRAPLAAFTLGRVLLDDLGRPREAADAFARARTVSPSGPMAQDSLAREVEAWSRAGETAIARERAAEYVRLYPDGRRLRSVLRYGGLE
jgi:transmembrane sensor